MASLCRIVVVTLTLTHLTAYAGEKKTLQPSGVDPQASRGASEGCADASKLSGICGYVYKNFDAPDESPYSYLWEKKIADAACVTPADTEETAARKIQKMWAALENEHLVCDAANFDISRGSILKYAVSLRNWDFLVTAADTWKVNLNKIDPSDDQTLLDYVRKEMTRTAEDPKYHGTLKMYYEVLRKRGAKHRSEL